ncbi:hypothetical protein K9M74_02200 [Candidatus Woesearchaeota archaeon]|nr:hypothetical protein [Candidatus Woesearchaeota archaeon]
MIVLVRCPKCKQTMRYEPRNNLISKRKTCVYCGRNFAVNQDTFIKTEEA